MFVQNITLFIFPDGVWSEMSLYHTDDVRYFVNTDKIQHRLSPENKKSGSNTQLYGISSFSCSEEHVVEISRHTTGVYSTNTEREVLPLLYIFNLSAQDEDNFKCYLCWCNFLTTFTGKYGLFRITRFYSFFSVRKKGSMDTSLWEEFNNKVIFPWYPNVSKMVHCCEFTNNIIPGPLIFNNYAGPCRLSKK